MKFKITLIFLLFLLIASPNATLGQSNKKPKIGLVLSGGGAKGIAHIGVLRELEKLGIKPDFIVGTSFGALVAGFYAIGYSPDQMEKIITSRDWDYLINDEIRRKNVLIGQGDKNKNNIFTLPLDGVKPGMSSGLYMGQNILTFFDIICREYNHKLNFDSLLIPFRCIGTNIETGEEKVFTEGYLPRVMRASMSIPSVFTPFEIDGELYVDGGLVNNFPTDVVKEMGADIIIGVDVGAVLYKKDEIKSILQILDQSSSFYNARITKKNKKLCDVYIRPDISGISAMGFDEVGEIINRGAQSIIEKIDEIENVLQSSGYSKQTITHLEKTDSIRIVSLSIKTNNDNKNVKNKSITKLVKGKLNLNLPTSLSSEELSDKINQVYGSKYFNQVSLEFEPIDSSYAMTISVKEKTENNFSIGGRFDQEYGVNILLSAEFRNLMLYGSLLEIKGIMGQSPHLGLRYTTDRGSNLGVGSSINYDFFEAHTYRDDKILSTYNYRRGVMDLFLSSHFGHYNRVVVGGEFSIFSLSTIQSAADIADVETFYFNAFASYVIDSWDNIYYPSKGFRMKIRGDIIGTENNTMYTHAWGRASNVFSINSKIKIITEGFIGVASIGVDSTMFRYENGGMANNRIEWYNAFPGIRFLEHGSNNVWIAKISPRYEFYKNNYITYTFALMALDNNTLDLFRNAENFYSGMSLKYGFNSMFGPLEISVDYSLQSYLSHYFISLGYWF